VMKYTLVTAAIAAALAMCTAASGADSSGAGYKDFPTATPVEEWTGINIGVSGGGSFHLQATPIKYTMDMAAAVQRGKPRCRNCSTQRVAMLSAQPGDLRAEKIGRAQGDAIALAQPSPRRLRLGLSRLASCQKLCSGDQQIVEESRG
jgi:hypothetical protein